MISYCPVCSKPVYFAERRRSLGKDYHPLCLKCFKCKRQLTPGQHADYDDKPFCNNCYRLQFGPRASRGPANPNSLTSGSTSSSSTLPNKNQTKS